MFYPGAGRYGGMLSRSASYHYVMNIEDIIIEGIMKLIKSAQVSDGKAGTKQVDILFDEKIKQISEDPLNVGVAEVIDLAGKLLIPGCIDAHVHFNDPGFTHREDFLSGTTAAAYGGITTIIDMPCTSIPPVTNVSNLRNKLAAIQDRAVIDYALFGGIRKNDLPVTPGHLKELLEAGVAGFKIYTISGMDSFKALSYDEIGDILSNNPGVLFLFHAEDEELVRKSENRVGSITPDNFSETRPVVAEVTAVKKILSRMGVSNKIHFVHISSSEAAKLILNSDKDVTFETCPHYLHFTSDDFPHLKGRLKTVPPVKGKPDREFLRKCLTSGDVDFISTDHAGCTWADEKGISDFSKVYSGIPGTELMIPYLFSEFFLGENVPLETMIDLTSRRAAERYGLYPNKGSLEIGTDADFTVIDLVNSFRVDESKLHSKGRYSPFDGMTFSCSIDLTIVRGNIVFEKDSGIPVMPGYGRLL